jgi:hypothetical protein
MSIPGLGEKRKRTKASLVDQPLIEEDGEVGEEDPTPAS